jgi:hypothetical protein
MSDSLLNKKACRKFALRWAQANRPGWEPERVARSYLEEAEAFFRLSLQRSITRHRSVGKTIKDFF